METARNETLRYNLMQQTNLWETPKQMFFADGMDFQISYKVENLMDGRGVVCSLF